MIDAFTENKFLAIKEHGVHEVITRCLSWGEDDRADEFEIIVLFNNDITTHKTAFGNRTLKMYLQDILGEFAQNGIELIQVS